MTATLDRLLEVLPPPYTLEPGSVLSQVLDTVALQSEVVQEDLDRLRRTHWLATHPSLDDRITRLAELYPSANTEVQL